MFFYREISNLNTDPYFANVSLLLRGAGTSRTKEIIDESVNFLQPIIYGNTALSTFKKYGDYSMNFDGNGDCLTFSDNSLFGFGIDDFTIEVWIYITGGQGTDRGITDFRTQSGGVGTFFIDGSTNKLAFWYGSKLGSTGTTLNTNTWYHVALSRQSGTFRCYLDGVLDWSADAVVDFGSSRPLGIGGSSISDQIASSPFNGYIDDLRITKGVARYTVNFTPPTEELSTISDPYFASVSLLLRGVGMPETIIGTILDQSNNSVVATIDGNTTLSAFKKYGNYSMKFDGTGDSLSFSNNSLFGFGTADFTIEGWIYITGSQGTDRNITDFRTFSGDVGTFFIDGPTNKLAFWYGSKLGATGTALNTNTWYHIALSRQSGTFRCYLDGVLDWSADAVVDFGSSRPLGIGGAAGSPMWSAFFNGYIDDLRITKGVARYTANFTPPTEELPAS